MDSTGALYADMVELAQRIRQAKKRAQLAGYKAEALLFAACKVDEAIGALHIALEEENGTRKRV